MQLHFRRISPDEVEKELTQRDQFDSDEVELMEALIREAHQNSLDAQPSGAGGPVRTRIAFHTPGEQDRKFLHSLLAPLARHLDASGIDASAIDLSNPKFLVIEDFGTTGLLGAWDRKDDKPFSDFWRRVGKSHKGGTAGGRWGLGKLVFSSASQARAFFGLTIRSDDPSGDALVMGQAVLKIHPDPDTGDELDGVGFFCELADSGLQLPKRDRGFVERFAAATGISRRGEPGLSIAIPYVRSDLQQDGLIRSLLRNYYFPILMGQLESRVGDTEVTAATFDALALQYGGERLGDGRVIAFVRELRRRLESGAPDFILPKPLTKDFVSGLSESITQRLRAEFAVGRLLHVRAPVSLRHRAEGPKESYIDLFLRQTEGDGQALIVRGGITLPLEGTEFRSRKCLAALIARDDRVAEFLGDAENPAHTKWNGNAEKLAANWYNGAARLSEIRGSLNHLYTLVAQHHETVERDAFLNIFSVPAAAGRQQQHPKPVSDPPPVPPIPRKPRLYDIRERKGGFVVTGTAALSQDHLPLRVRIDAAYALAGGDPFARHSDVDFDFRRYDLQVNSAGARWEARSANSIDIEATQSDFEVQIVGFDINRDLVVRGGKAS